MQADANKQQMEKNIKTTLHTKQKLQKTWVLVNDYMRARLSCHREGYSRESIKQEQVVLCFSTDRIYDELK